LNQRDLIYLIEKALLRRAELFDDGDSNCFRIFNGLADGLDGLAIDYYDGHILIQYFTQVAMSSLMEIVKSLDVVFAKNKLTIKSILAKNRNVKTDDAGNSFWRSTIIDGTYNEEAGLVVKQNGCLAKVDLVNGQNTGIFLDMREVRKSLGQFYSEKKIESMANLFCYTALFSVHAIKSGIKRSINVDLSKSVLRRAKDNYLLNEIDVDDRDFIFGDALKWVKIFAKKNTVFDFLIFDPPTFARGKKSQFSVRSDYKKSLEIIGDIIPEGYILTSVNSHFVTKREYMSYHPEKWELLMFTNESSDFINTKAPYLKVGLWKVRL